MKKNSFKIIGLIAIIAFLSFACGSDDSDDSGGGGQIESALIGTWDGMTIIGGVPMIPMTIIFSNDKIVFIGTSSFAKTVNDEITHPDNKGCAVEWAAKDGFISYTICGEDGSDYGYICKYIIAGNKLGLFDRYDTLQVVLTRLNVGSFTPHSLPANIDSSLFGQWKDRGASGAILDVTFFNGGIIWSGMVGDMVYAGIAEQLEPGMEWGWETTTSPNVISIKYEYNGMTGTKPLFSYVLSGSQLTLTSLTQPGSPPILMDYW